jgi:MarR family transcriptional regulator, organic hydroperoxide resistance regulator
MNQMTPPGRDRKTTWKLPILIEPGELELRNWLLLARIYHRVVRRLGQVLERHSLSLAQFEVLAVLHFGEGMTQQEMAARLLVTKGNICGMIDRMEAGGWVERRPDPEDRRVNRLFLTPEGRRLRAEAVPAHHELVRSLMSGLTGPELQSLHHLLDRLEDGMGDESHVGDRAQDPRSAWPGPDPHDL